jgi:hypothetical protein
MTRTDSGLDRPDPDEDSTIHAIADIVVASVRHDYPPGTLARRDAHPKHHAIVRAELRVESNLPTELRHGIFATPRAYPAWIRFSNGSPTIQPDSRRDQRGMAIKLLGVPGAKVLADEVDAPTQDFVLASSSRFFIRSVRDYVDFTRAATKKPAFRVLSYFFRGAPWQWRMHELLALTGSLQHAEDLLRLRYWSQTPFRLGPHVVKYSARPFGDAVPAAARTGRSPDFLREALAARLRDGPATFEFLVQRQTDPASMPIEDATIEWDEARAPFARVATITIPAQRFDSDAQMTFAEQISYTPWHTLPEHAPMGGVNRTRRIVYEAVSRARHGLNGTLRREPTSLDLNDEMFVDHGTPRAAAEASRKDVL